MPETATLPAPVVGNLMVVAGPLPVEVVGTPGGIFQPGTPVRIVEVGISHGPEWVSAVDALGTGIDLKVTELVPDPTCAAGGHEHCPLHGCVEYVCCGPTPTTEEPEMQIAVGTRVRRLSTDGAGEYANLVGRVTAADSGGGRVYVQYDNGLLGLPHSTNLEILDDEPVGVSAARPSGESGDAARLHENPAEPIRCGGPCCSETYVRPMSDPYQPASPVEWEDATLAGTLQAGDRLLEVDGFALAATDPAEAPGAVIEEVRHLSNGDLRVTVWGASRMFEICLQINDPVRFRARG